MKRLVGVILCLALAVGQMMLACDAAGDTAVGYTLHTDIVAQINGHALRSYNVDGYTAVVAEDLKDYGFRVYWDGANRRLEVERAADATGAPAMPLQWPQYTPDGAQGVVGTRARTIYATDIVTTVAGRGVQSFNVGGETLIWFDDLAAYGAVRWDAQARVISLELGDPLQIALDEMTRNLEDWKLASPESYYESYFHDVSGQGGPSGVLFYAVYSGAMHGTARNLTWVDSVGTQTNIGALISTEYPGPAFTLIPREIRMEGEMLTFFTPVSDLGDCLCKVNLRTGALVTLQPLDRPLEDWVVNSNGWQTDAFTAELDVSVVCDQGQAKMTELALPGSGLGVTVSAGGVRLYHAAFMLFGDEQYAKTDYAKAYQALGDLALPRVTQENFSPENTPEQREQVAQHLSVTVNGTPVSGNLWWSQGNNHVDLNFDFDQPVQLKQGDILRVHMG